MVTVDMTKNPKQGVFFNTVMEAAFGDRDERYFFYGGAIRGGKTYISIAIIIMLCKVFPGSKWYVIRSSFARLKETTIPTASKILANTSNIKWNRDASNYHVEFLNTKSKIFFTGEDLKNDPDLNWMLGLECNGFVLEQIEELSEKLFDMAIQRSGSWIIPKMPTPLILSTFNPTNKWVKEKIHDKHIVGELKPPYYYLEALSNDNPYNTSEQWKNWQNLDKLSYKRFIEGSWEFDKPSNLFIYSLEDNKHFDSTITINEGKEIYLSFDFNVEPITCIVSQHDINSISICKEYRLLNSDIFELCERIKTDFPGGFFIVTGDSTGRARSAISRGNRNYYQIIQSELMITNRQIIIHKENPSIKNTRVLCNALLSKHINYKINNKLCPYLTIDLNSVTVDEHGNIDKGSDKHKTHLLDCWRYYNWTFHRNFLDKKLYQNIVF